MDTINIILNLNEELKSREIEEVEEYIEKTGYCDVLRSYGTRELNIRLSYPRYFSKTNAFLIKSADECFEVQEDFVRVLQSNPLTRNSTIRIVRADVPFTFIMDKGEEFYMYKNIFKILAEVYSYEYPNSDPKRIMSMLKEREETLIYSDNQDSRNYYQRVMIYDQWKKFRDKYSKNDFEQLCREFPNLIRRIRIEYSVRVSKNRSLGREMSLNKFEEFNIFNTYVPKAIDYVLDNLLNEKHIDDILNDKTDEVEKMFFEEKKRGKIYYENFIYKNLDLIVDYSIIRQILNQIENIKTREGAIRVVRQILRRYEEKSGLIIMKTYHKIEKMIDFFYSNPLEN